MKNEIIKITCESCGAPLNVNPSSSIIKCDYCNRSYLVPKLIENYARCPLCGRNDRVEKVSKVVKNEGLRKILSFNKEDFYIPKFIPEPHWQLENRRILWKGLMIISPVYLIVFLISSSDSICVGISIIAFLIGFFLDLNSNKQIELIKSRNELNEKKWKLELQKRKVYFNKLKPVQKKLYYCHRDDIIFLPNQGDYASPENLKEYLNKHA